MLPRKYKRFVHNYEQTQKNSPSFSVLFSESYYKTVIPHLAVPEAFSVQKQDVFVQSSREGLSSLLAARPVRRTSGIIPLHGSAHKNKEPLKIQKFFSMAEEGLEPPTPRV